MSNVLVVAEHRGGELRKVALEAMSVARSVADAAGGEVHALLAGIPLALGSAGLVVIARRSDRSGNRRRWVVICSRVGPVVTPASSQAEAAAAVAIRVSLLEAGAVICWRGLS